MDHESLDQQLKSSKGSLRPSYMDVASALMAFFALMIGNPRVAKAAELEILAQPADVPVYEVTNPSEKKLLGKTPLNLPEWNSDQPRVLLLESPGYASVYLPLSNLRSKATVKVNLKRMEDWNLLQGTFGEGSSGSIAKKADQIVERVVTIQNLLDLRKVKEAMVLADDLKSQNPNSYAVRLVYANALLMSGERKKALTLYSALLEQLPPQNRSMRASIQTIVEQMEGTLPTDPKTTSNRSPSQENAPKTGGKP